MAAHTITDDGHNATERVTMEATPGNAREIIIPQRYARITLYFTSSSDAAEAGKYASSGTDAAAIGNDVLPIASGVYYPVAQSGGARVDGSTWSVFVSGSTASGYCYAHCEEQNDG
ncbi:MAG: hypothetical protein GY900_08130 [Actinomycetia bacterium]|nr:hypothetical protein [Actinomycetales bacterium]MCP4851687.1 hypothetical protein [Actinomycetes bacterium]